MKKTFLPLHIGYVFIYLLCVFLSCVGTYVATIGIYTLLVYKYVGALVLIFSGVLTICLFLFILIYNVHNRIIFKEKKIIVTGHFIKKDGLQFSDEIRYDEIQNIAIICANANSLKKQIKKAGYSSLRPYVYYEFTLINGQTKWILIECFSKWQRKKMLNIINDKVGLNLFYNQLERKDFSIYKNRKRK